MLGWEIGYRQPGTPPAERSHGRKGSASQPPIVFCLLGRAVSERAYTRRIGGFVYLYSLAESTVIGDAKGEHDKFLLPPAR